MKDETATPTPEQVKTDQRGPIPLADRRRLMRQSDSHEKPSPVFNDWASI